MHIAVGTPMQGGQCTSDYVNSMLALKDACHEHGIKLTCIFIGNESLVLRGRNTIVHHFLKTDASHLLFLDADQGSRANDIARMIKTDKGIIAAAVPMKGIDWERVRAGALAGHTDLEKLTGIFNVAPIAGHAMTDPAVPFQVRCAGTGMMLIRRDVFDDLAPHVDWYGNGGATIPQGERVCEFFKAGVVDHEYLSEDFWFCDLYRKHGGSVWIAPWCEVGHRGAYLFSGCYADMR